MPHVLVFCPMYGNMVTKATFDSMMALMPALMHKGIGSGVASFSYPEISEARNIALTAWYDMPGVQASHLLMVDADMGFVPELVLDMLLFDEPMVGALYCKKTLPVQWAASGLGGEHTERRGNFMKVAGLGMGCFLIRRDAITKMLEAMPEMIDTRVAIHAAKDMLPSGRMFRFFDPMDSDEPGHGRLSEDLAFCHRWRTVCGGDIWGAAGHTIEHFGGYSYRANYIEHVAQQAKDADKGGLAYVPGSAA